MQTPLRLIMSLVALVVWTNPSVGVVGRSTAAGQAIAFDVVEASIEDLQAALTSGRLTSVTLVDRYLARIEAYDQQGPAINAFITINPRAREIAETLDRERAVRGVRGPLHGIPIVVKDNFDTADMPTTGGSIALATHQPARDAYQVRRLREAGAIVIGKTNLHELAAGITTVSSLGGQTRNPYDPTRNPGGSSGGTGAAVAASFAAAGLGTDTCGSIRIPASHNSLVGLRSTAGLTSRAGVIPLSHTQDVAGPLARSVADVAILLDATVGVDPDDPTTEVGRGRSPASYRAALDAAPVDGVRVGVLLPLFGADEADAELGRLVRDALERLRAAGLIVVEVDVPDLQARQRNTSVIDHEFKFDLLDYLAAAAGAPVASLAEILERGLHHRALTRAFTRRNATASRDSEPYRTAMARRAELRAAVLAAMDAHGVAALAYPTMRREPARIGESQGGTNCQLSPATGLPALTVPAAFTGSGLPVGLELLGRAFSESDLLAIGRAVETVVAARRPPPTTPPLDAGAPAIRVGPAPGPDAEGSPTARFEWDATRGVLRYSVDAGVAADEVLLMALRYAGDGPVVARLLRTGRREAIGEAALSGDDREALAAGTLVVQLFTRRQPLGGPIAPVVIR